MDSEKWGEGRYTGGPEEGFPPLGAQTFPLRPPPTIIEQALSWKAGLQEQLANIFLGRFKPWQEACFFCDLVTVQEVGGWGSKSHVDGH